MRAACCEATVLCHEVIADDIRLLTALWPDASMPPTRGSSSPLRAWGADEAPFPSRPISVHKWDAETQTVEFLHCRRRGDPQADCPGKGVTVSSLHRPHGQRLRWPTS